MLKVTGEKSDHIIRAIIEDHKKYIKCRKTDDGYRCSVKGSPNDVRKTLNEFLESVVYLERVSESIEARVG